MYNQLPAVSFVGELPFFFVSIIKVYKIQLCRFSLHCTQKSIKFLLMNKILLSISLESSFAGLLKSSKVYSFLITHSSCSSSSFVIEK